MANESLDVKLHFALERARAQATFFRFEGDGQFGAWQEARANDPRAVAFYTADDVRLIVHDVTRASLGATPAAPAEVTDDELISALDSDGIACDPELAFTIRDIVQRLLSPSLREQQEGTSK